MISLDRASTITQIQHKNNTNKKVNTENKRQQK
jgi:hypothetical protein